MSHIRIECRKDKFDAEDRKNYEKYKEKHSLDGELIINASQVFMNTEKFFNSIKPTLEKYFDMIEKK